MASVVSALGERKGTRMERASGASSVDHVVAVAIISAIQIFAMQRSWARGIGEKRRMTSTTDGWTEREGTCSVTNISKGLAAVMMKLPFTSKQEGTDDFASRGTIEFVGLVLNDSHRRCQDATTGRKTLAVMLSSSMMIRQTCISIGMAWVDPSS